MHTVPRSHTLIHTHKLIHRHTLIHTLTHTPFPSCSPCRSLIRFPLSCSAFVLVPQLLPAKPQPSREPHTRLLPTHLTLRLLGTETVFFHILLAQCLAYSEKMFVNKEMNPWWFWSDLILLSWIAGMSLSLSLSPSPSLSVSFWNSL